LFSIFEKLDILVKKAILMPGALNSDPREGVLKSKTRKRKPPKGFLYVAAEALYDQSSPTAQILSHGSCLNLVLTKKR
jgi:hypothetical protein